MNCIFCQTSLVSKDSYPSARTILDCKRHNNWNIKYEIYNSANSNIYLTDTLSRIVLISTDDQFIIERNVLEQKTVFYKIISLDRPRTPFATINESLDISPDNATDWINKMLNLAVYS